MASTALTAGASRPRSVPHGGADGQQAPGSTIVAAIGDRRVMGRRETSAITDRGYSGAGNCLSLATSAITDRRYSGSADQGTASK